MLLTLSLAISYLLAGVSEVSGHLTARAMDKPAWARRPTIAIVVLEIVIWPLGSLANAGFGSRAKAFGLLGIVGRLAVLTFAVWLALTTSAALTHTLALRIVVGAVLLVLAIFVLLPLLNLLMVPVTLLLAFPLDLLFPLKDREAAKHIPWCRNCASYRRVKGYESAVCQAPTLPDPDLLPCSRFADTAQVWGAYYDLERGKRTLFPKDCPTFTPKRR